MTFRLGRAEGVAGDCIQSKQDIRSAPASDDPAYWPGGKQPFAAHRMNDRDAQERTSLHRATQSKRYLIV